MWRNWNLYRCAWCVLCRRGFLTFDEVMNFYLRKRREFLASGKDYKMRAPVEAEELAKLKLHQHQYVLTECDMHSQPLLLFRILFFVAMQDSRGEIHMLTAFQVCETRRNHVCCKKHFSCLLELIMFVHIAHIPQNLSQLFGRVAEDQFNCIFLKNFAKVTDDDRYSLAEFVNYIKKFRVKVKHIKIVAKRHESGKAALIRLKGKGADSVAADRRKAIVCEESIIGALLSGASPNRPRSTNGSGSEPSSPRPDPLFNRACSR